MLIDEFKQFCNIMNSTNLTSRGAISTVLFSVFAHLYTQADNPAELFNRFHMGRTLTEVHLASVQRHPVGMCATDKATFLMALERLDPQFRSFVLDVCINIQDGDEPKNSPALPEIKWKVSSKRKSADTVRFPYDKDGLSVSYCHIPSSPHLVETDLETVVAAANEGSLRVWKLGGDRVPPTVFPMDGMTSGLSVSEGEILTCNSKGRAHLWTFSGVKTTFKVSDRAALSVAFAPPNGEKRFVTGDASSCVRLWNADRPHPVSTFPITTHGQVDVSLVAWHPTSRYVFSAVQSDICRMWDLDSKGGPVRLLTGCSRPLSSIAPDCTGQFLAAGTCDGHIILWDVVAGKKLCEWTSEYGTDPKPVYALGWSTSGDTLVAGCGDETLLFERPSERMVCMKRIRVPLVGSTVVQTRFAQGTKLLSVLTI